MYQIDIAKTSHKVYLLHLDLRLSGIETDEVSSLAPCDVHACNFGKWLDTAEADYRSLNHYGEVVQTHQHFHEQTCELLRLLKDEGQEAARRYFETTLHDTSVKLFDLLDRLKVDRRIQTDLTEQAETAHVMDDFPVELLTGVPAIDQQHKELHVLTHKLLENAEEKIYAEHSNELLSMLNTLFITHFKTEEDFMKRKGVSGEHIAHHIGQHTRFLEDFISLQLEAMSHAPKTAGDVYSRLMEWELNHMRTLDIHLKVKPA